MRIRIFVDIRYSVMERSGNEGPSIRKTNVRKMQANSTEGSIICYLYESEA